MTFKKGYWKKRNEARQEELNSQAFKRPETGSEPTRIKKFHDEWCLANGYKLSSNRTQESRPQAKGSSFKPKSTSSRIREPE